MHWKDTGCFLGEYIYFIFGMSLFGVAVWRGVVWWSGVEVLLQCVAVWHGVVWLCDVACRLVFDAADWERRGGVLHNAGRAQPRGQVRPGH